MKKSILAIAIAAIFASCSNNKPAEPSTAATPAVNTQDTIGLSDYKEWKEKQELQSTQQTYTSPGVTEITPPAEEKPAKPIVIYRDAPVRQSRIAKTSKPAKNPVKKAPAEETEKPGIAKSPSPESSGAKREPYGRSTGSGTGTGTEASTGGETGTSNEEDKTVASSPTEVPAKKEGGWSKTAKGTAIGGASGAVIGAIFSKNKAKGAVIGGVVGAAGGYIFGRNKEKKEAKN